MMVALLLYAYARGIRSSRVIERACVEDVAFRVVAAQQRPDHATIARFIERHQDGAGRVVRRGAFAVRAVGLGQGRGHRDRRHQGAGQRQPRRERRLRAARARDHRGGQGASTRPRTSSTATRAATSCPRSCRPRRADAGGCARPSGAWRPSATARRSRCRARGPGASRRPSGAWKRNCGRRGLSGEVCVVGVTDRPARAREHTDDRDAGFAVVEDAVRAKAAPSAPAAGARAALRARRAP